MPSHVSSGRTQPICVVNTQFIFCLHCNHLRTGAPSACINFRVHVTERYFAGQVKMLNGERADVSRIS